MLRASLTRPLRHFSASSSSASAAVTWRAVVQRQVHSESQKEQREKRDEELRVRGETGSEGPLPAGASGSEGFLLDESVALGKSIPLSAPLPPASSSVLPPLEDKVQVEPEPSTTTPSSSPSSSPSDTLNTLPPAYDLDKVKQQLRHWTEHAAVVIRSRADDFTSSTKTTFSQLGVHLNKVTGYEEIEALKRDVVAQEQRINETRLAARQAKVAYEDAVVQRSKSQREVNDLLQRKSTWSDNDVSRFTTLVRQDHLFEQAEQRAKASVNESEDAVEKEFSRLMRLILARYHEEQVWSDKIRSASTYGQLAALGLNLLVFVLAIILVEPWKRKRLAQTFEKKVEELSSDYARMLEESMRGVEGKLVGHEALLVAVAQELAKRVEEAEEVPLEETAIAEGTVVARPEQLSLPSEAGVRIPGLDVTIPPRTVEMAGWVGMFAIGALTSYVVNAR